MHLQAGGRVLAMPIILAMPITYIPVQAACGPVDDRLRSRIARGNRAPPVPRGSASLAPGFSRSRARTSGSWSRTRAPRSRCISAARRSARTSCAHSSPARRPGSKGATRYIGKQVIEVRPARADKGEAVARYLDVPPFSGRRPVFAGDDMTDEDGFTAVSPRRHQRQGRGGREQGDLPGSRCRRAARLAGRHSGRSRSGLTRLRTGVAVPTGFRRGQLRIAATTFAEDECSISLWRKIITSKDRHHEQDERRHRQQSA